MRAGLRKLPRGPYISETPGRSSAWSERRVWDAEVRRFESGRPDFAKREVRLSNQACPHGEIRRITDF
jgi:hypothetical protein